jgi:hypothetical protein
MDKQQFKEMLYDCLTDGDLKIELSTSENHGSVDLYVNLSMRDPRESGRMYRGFGEKDATADIASSSVIINL